MRELRRAVRRQEMDTGFEPTNFREITSKNGNRMEKTIFRVSLSKETRQFHRNLNRESDYEPWGWNVMESFLAFGYTARTILSLWLVAYLGLHDALLLLLRPRQHAKQACLVQV